MISDYFPNFLRPPNFLGPPAVGAFGAAPGALAGANDGAAA